MGLNYEKERTKATERSVMKPEDKMILMAKQKGFPDCKGLYPDCPQDPKKDCEMCRSCPVNE